jgi:integrase
MTNVTLRPNSCFIREIRHHQRRCSALCFALDRNTNGRVTTRTISRIAKNHLRGINLDSDRLTARSFRHTAITLSLKGGATIQEAQGMARHASITTTMEYAHNMDRIKTASERKIDALLAAG